MRPPRHEVCLCALEIFVVDSTNMEFITANFSPFLYRVSHSLPNPAFL